MNRSSFRRGPFVVFGTLALALLAVLPAHAHHGWGWATDEQFELTGEITGTALGNPHGEVTLEADGEEWTVEVGQPWRNERAGLSEDRLAEGTRMTVQGHRSNNASERLVKAERVVIDGETHDLYPGRD